MVINEVEVGTTKDPWSAFLEAHTYLISQNFFFLRNQCSRNLKFTVVAHGSLVLNLAVVRSIAKLCVPRK